MKRRSKIAILVPVVLLLFRCLVPVVQGQIIPLEWNHKSDPIKLYRQQSVLSTADRAFLSNPTNRYWLSGSDPTFASSRNKELVGIPASQLQNVGLHQQLSPNVYLLLNEQRHAIPPPRSIAVTAPGLDDLETLNSKLFYQQPKKRQETDTSLTGSGPPLDYSSDDDTSAQQIQSASPSREDYSQPPPSKPKLKRQGATPDGLARYLIFSNLKRARDGYICHFKLCQVGVSGKRLSNM